MLSAARRLARFGVERDRKDLPPSVVDEVALSRSPTRGQRIRPPVRFFGYKSLPPRNCFAVSVVLTSPA
jgi:hypothetical protein